MRIYSPDFFPVTQMALYTKDSTKDSPQKITTDCIALALFGGKKKARVSVFTLKVVVFFIILLGRCWEGFPQSTFPTFVFLPGNFNRTFETQT